VEQDSRIAAAISLVTGPAGGRWTVAELASALELSPSYLRHLFVTNLGVSPKRFLKSVQLQKAELLLRTSTLQVKSVMRQAGFGDPSHFARDFSKQFGASPHSYRLHVARRKRAGETAHIKANWPIAREK
jgi:transcriptional regulator GlxA family with amidase domain